MKLRTPARPRRRVAVAAGLAALTAAGTVGVALSSPPAEALCSGYTCYPEPGEGGGLPRPTTTAARPPVAALSWSVAPRSGGAFDSDDVNALTAYVSSPNQIRLNACGSTAGTSAIASFTWNFNGATFSGCSPTVTVPGRSGSFNASVTVRDTAGRTSTASTTGTWKDTFVVTLGDSIASGEGNPEVAQQYDWFGFVKAGPQWPNKHCHRTPKASSQQSANAFELSHPDQAVTYVNLACSGATIMNVIPTALGGQPYVGIEPQHAANPPQMDVLKTLETNTGRLPDAVVVSAGANDFGFGPIADQCARMSHDGSNSCAQLNPTVEAGHQALLQNYPKLKSGLDNVQVPSNKVVISQYPNPTRTDSGQFCDTILNDTPLGLGTVHKEDVVWADGVVNRLNTDVANAAMTNGWNITPGITSGFLTHGYCASNHWITRYSESGHDQGNDKGTLHPNAPGTAHYSAMLTQALAAGNLLR